MQGGYIYLSQIVPHATALAKDAIRKLRKSERLFKRHAENSYAFILAAADDLERAATYLRGYVKQMRKDDA